MPKHSCQLVTINDKRGRGLAPPAFSGHTFPWRSPSEAPEPYRPLYFQVDDYVHTAIHYVMRRELLGQAVWCNVTRWAYADELAPPLYRGSRGDDAA